jgi:hypothetical protein
MMANDQSAVFHRNAFGISEPQLQDAVGTTQAEGLAHTSPGQRPGFIGDGLFAAGQGPASSIVSIA